MSFSKIISASLILYSTVCVSSLTAQEMFSLSSSGAAVPDWSGAYAGLVLSHTGFTLKPDDSFGTFSGLPPLDVSGGLFGAVIGYNWQRDRFVFGVEADIRTGSPSASLTNGFYDPIKHDLSYSIGARLGYAAGNFLPYLKLAWINSSFTSDLRSGNTPVLEDRAEFSSNGYAFGFGFEWLINENFSARLEYLKHKYDDASFTHRYPSGVTFDSSTPIDADSVTLMVTYRF